MTLTLRAVIRVSYHWFVVSSSCVAWGFPFGTISGSIPDPSGTAYR